MTDRSCEARLETRSGQPMMLERVVVTGEVRGMLFEASVVQDFCNPGDSNAEVVYTFPLPWKAVLLDVVVTLGSLELQGRVVDRKKAEAGYEEALAEGDTAILLQENHDRTYSLNLGNLASGERCTVSLRYSQVLTFAQRSVRLMVPTVIAPRFGNDMIDGGLLPHQAPVTDLASCYPFEIVLRLFGQFASAQVASPSHPIAFAHHTASPENVLVVRLQRQGALDRDFVLVIDALANDAVGLAAPDTVTPGAVAVLAGFCPGLGSHAARASCLVLKTLVDCSGSMAGDSITAAKHSLKAIVEQLAPEDRFSLSRFGSSVAHRSRSLWQVTDVTRLAARRWIDALEADLGGTDMAGALASTFTLAAEVATDVLLVTDGQISAIETTISAAVSSGHRLFIVAIGSSPVESHLRRLAEATGGACEFVLPGEMVGPAVLRMFHRLRAPRIHDVQVAWPDGCMPLWSAPLLPAVFDGETVVVQALFACIPKGPVRLLGARMPAGVLEELGRLALLETGSASDALCRVVASERVLTEPELAVPYQLVTSQTSFLLVHARAAEDKQHAIPVLHKVPQMLPAGWGGLAQVGAHGVLAPSTMCSRGSINATQAKTLRLPAVFRRASSPPYASDARQVYDIPAFLRKSVPLVDDSDPLHWTVGADHAGFTPLGLSRWLESMPPAEWPATPDALRQIGVPAWVVEWLDLIADSTGVGGECKVAAVSWFLQVMSRSDLRDALQSGVRSVQSLDVVQQEFDAHDERTMNRSHRQLLVQMLASLRDMQADRWPDSIYALAVF